MSARPVGGGYTGNRRFAVELADGRRAFVKWAYDDASGGWLREEHRMYAALAGRPYMPRLLGWDDDGEHPLLAIEDLSEAHWPPPWRDGDVEAVRTTLAQVAATPPPGGLPTASDRVGGVEDWERVRAEPEPFLSLGVCTREWLDDNCEVLLAAARDVPLAGDALLHFDVRSDNLCLQDGQALLVSRSGAGEAGTSAPVRVRRAYLVDWNWACVGNADADVATWAPSIYLEAGVPPWELVSDGGSFAAWMAGFWGARAGLPPPPGADPAMRVLQRRQLAVVLEWAERELGLPPREMMHA